MANFTISGQIVTKDSRLPVPGVRVEAWNWDIQHPELLGESGTDALGNYAISLDDAYFRGRPIDALPEVLFKILRGDRILESYLKKVLWNPRIRTVTLDLEVSLAAPPEEPIPNLVLGRVSTTQGKPLEGLLAQAWDKNLKEDVLLGEENTNETGFYSIAYKPKEALPQGKTQADLLVKVLDNKAQLLATSSLYCKAQPSQEINFQLETETYRGPSEFERLHRALTPYLEGTEMAELTPEQIEYLVCKSGEDKEKITALVKAYQNMQEADVLPEAFYGLSRKEKPMELAELLAQPLANLREALEQATYANIIPLPFKDRLAETMARLKELVVEQLLRAPEIKTDYSLSGLFNISLPLIAKQKTLLGLWLSREGTTEDFWKNLSKHPDFTEKGLVEEIQFTLQLNTLSQSHLPLIQWLRQRNNKTKFKTVRDLVTLEKADWLKMLDDKVGGTAVGYPPHITGTDEAEKKNNYATAIFRLVENAFPMARLTHKVSQDTLPEKDDLLTFLHTNIDFEFDKVYLERYLKQDGRLARVNDKAALTTRLRGMQRLYKLTPRYEEMQLFMNEGMDSAWSVVQKGKAGLKEILGDSISEGQLEEIFTSAENVASTTMFLYMKGKEYGPIDNSNTPAINAPVFPNPELPKEIAEDVSNWTEMFGSFNLCECEHCRSIYSPAAYMVDLLQFLNKPSETKGKSVKALLLERRPDLAEIELSCANTNTVMPYVDLVNEVLENAIAPNSFSFPTVTDLVTALDAAEVAKIPMEALDHFSDYGFPLSEKPAIEVITKGKEWIMSDGAWRYKITKNSTQFDILPSPQTSGKAEDIGAQPEHLNKNAYDLLKKEIFPLSLPFDLWLQEIHLYLGHLGVPLYQIKETFLNDTEKNELISEAYLRIPPMAADLIKGDKPDPWEWWGLKESNNTIIHPGTKIQLKNKDWIYLMRQVPIFLHRSGLDYSQLLELLTSRFFNPYGRIIINSIDQIDSQTCDINKMQLNKNLDTEALKRASRFLRLWRALGWSMKDVDTAIMALYGDVEFADLTRFYHLKYLHDELRVPVDEILTWWDRIDNRKTDAKISTLFEKLFLSKSLENPIEEDFKKLLNEEDEKEAFGRKIILYRISKESLDAIKAENDPPSQTILKNLELILDQDFPNILTFLDQLVAQIGEPDTQKYRNLIVRHSTVNNHVPTVTAALRITEVEYQLLAQGLFKKDAIIDLNIRNLTWLYRVVSMARALKLSIKEFFIVRSLIRINPFGKALTGNTLLFLQKVKWLKATGLKIGEMDYLLRHRFDLNENSVPIQEQITLLAVSIRKELIKIKSDNTRIKIDSGALLSKFQLILPEALAQAAVQLVEGPATKKEAIENEPKRKKFINDYFADFLVPADAEKILIPFDNTEVKKEERLQYIWKNLAPYLIDRLGKNQLIQLVATHLKLEVGTAGKLLEDLLISLENKTHKAIDDLMRLQHTGLSAVYTDPAKTVDLIDTTVDFIWEEEPVPGISNDKYTVAWTGKVIAESKEAYTFYLVNTHKAKLTIDGQVYTNTATLEPKELIVGPLTLKEGSYYEIKLEYDKGIKGKAEIALYWSQAGKVRTVVPENNLFPYMSEQIMESLNEDYILLHKSAMLINQLGIRADELDNLAPYFDWNAWPLEPQQEVLPKLWENLEALIDLMYVRNHLNLNEYNLLGLIVKTKLMSQPDFQKLLSDETGWPVESIAFMASSKQLNLKYPDDYRKPAVLLKLYHHFNMMDQLGLSAENVVEWLIPEITYTKALKFKKAVKAKYNDQDWLAVAKPLKDTLRKQQLDAMVAYLTSQSPNLKNAANAFDANDLYRYYLIDVEMDSCMMTSRIKQANGTIQLFVQRAMMGLEKGILLDEDARQEWKWRKNYRVWEANRKVFLYPENWIEPELRDDKTPFFKELETELLQNEITEDTVEDAFVNYLYKLDEVAQLNLVGMYHDLDTATIHVFGRTHSEPHIYYYRRQEKNSWTPWEKMDLDIEGDHLMPVIWNRRLYLFWPIFIESAKKGEDKSEWKISFGWSEYKSKKWTTKNQSPSIKAMGDGFFRPKNSFSFQIITTPIISIEILIRSSIEVDKKDKPEQDHRWRWGEYLFNGCNGNIIARDYPGGFKPNSVALNKTYFENNYLVLDNNQGEGLELQKGPFVDTNNVPKLRNSRNSFTVLSTTQPFEKSLKYYKVVYAHQNFHYTSENPFFYQDNNKSYFVDVISELEKFKSHTVHGEEIDGVPVTDSYDVYAEKEVNKFLFQTFYHPYVCEFIKVLNAGGIQYLLRREIQAFPMNTYSIGTSSFLLEGYTKKGKENGELPFAFSYVPSKSVKKPYPIENVDFDLGGAFESYNWELFFHIPLLIADRLTKNQRFEEALKWFHFIFDPKATFTDFEKSIPIANTNPEARYWKVMPFFNNMNAKQSLLEIMGFLHVDDPGSPLKNDPELSEARKKLKGLIEDWQNNPFNPHLIARSRLAAYQKTVVMKYLDTLIAWGDQLFRRDTIESLNEATQYYILASEILYVKPQKVSRPAALPIKTYSQLEQTSIDALSNPLVNIENIISQSGKTPPTDPEKKTSILLSMGNSLYFCIPKNEKLLEYWDTIADRLFKIRHCMNIEGITRQLPLFEPPIDPALLVKAVAAGVDISSALNDLYAPLPHYRFSYVLQKALELCQEVKSLGANLLSVLEKKDAEELALLRTGQETSLLKAIKEIKKQQIREARETLDGIHESRAITEERFNYYKNIEKVNKGEKEQLDQLGVAQNFQVAAQLAQIGASVAFASVPTVEVGASGMGPHTTTLLGGTNIGHALQAVSAGFSFLANKDTYDASMASIDSGHDRRWDEWKLQEKLASKELLQIDKQIAAAEIRQSIAENELSNHEKQIENAGAVESHMKSKYTNKDLYSWMQGQISGIFFQTYQLAYDLAKKAERAYQFELGIDKSDFIQFGYWDNLKKGLLSGEKLYHALKRMESAYMDQNRRRYELTRHISLVMLKPLAVLELREKGSCEFDIPELLFDLDFPGQYMRRIKSVTVSIPCIIGPFTNVNAKLTLLKSRVRKKANAQTDYEYTGLEDANFSHNPIGIQSIATSSGQNDSGMFEFNFRDERLLPFEGAGGISSWRLELPGEFRQFNYDTISDVIVHLNYTAFEGGDVLKQLANKHVNVTINKWLDELAKEDDKVAGLQRMFSLRHEFSNEWHQLLYGGKWETHLKIEPQHFPYYLRERKLKLTIAGNLMTKSNATIYWKINPIYSNPPIPPKVAFNVDAINANTDFKVLKKDVGNLFMVGLDLNTLDPRNSWNFQIDNKTNSFKPEEVEDILIIMHYTISK
ncbi:MAG: neuraminidase-like domain-containing protein [Candidatus Scalindua sp.]|nr:neuraminidase-like domain-containing protein [Candidatus Scalindua sp.]